MHETPPKRTVPFPVERAASASPPLWLFFFLAAALGGSGTAAFAAAEEFEVLASIRIEGNGRRYTAGIVVPTDWPEQQVETVEERAHNATGRIERVGPGVAMLLVRTHAVPPGGYAEAMRRFRVRVEPVELDVDRDDFPPDRRVDRSLGAYLKPSPGIESDDRSIAELVERLGGESAHPWDFARAAFDWVHDEIQYREGDFTSAATAVRTRIGDCEEKASVFIALCRARGIPARTVWTPDHCWAEFHLVDGRGEGRWIPAHTSGARWFAAVRTPNVILQKGDNFRPPQRAAAATRLLGPWLRGPAPAPEWRRRLEVRRVGEAPPDGGESIGPE
jgi:hypothetical protein